MVQSAAILPPLLSSLRGWKLAFLALVAGSAVFQLVEATATHGAAIVMTPTQAELESALLSGQPVTFGFSGTIHLTNSLVIQSDTAIDGSGQQITLDAHARGVRHFIVTNGATLRLTGLTLANGVSYIKDATEAPGNPGWGGAIHSVGGTLELVRCTFRDNMIVAGTGTDGGPAGGGAIYCADSRLTLKDCVFYRNSAVGGRAIKGKGGAGFGGAVYSTNTVLVVSGAAFWTNTTFGGQSSPDRYQSPPPSGSAQGGALAHAGASAALSRCEFLGNIARGWSQARALGGALYLEEGTLHVDESCFNANIAAAGEGGYSPTEISYAGDAFGGAIMNQSGRVEMARSALILNQARGGDASPWMFSPTANGSGYGGAIFNRGDLLLVNCAVAENLARDGTQAPLAAPGWGIGGGICGSATLVNVTMARNRVESLAAEKQSGSSIAGEAVLTNSILFTVPGQTNVGPNVFDSASQRIIDGGHNICSDDSARLSTTTSRNGLDPLLGPVANHGGFTPTVPLLPRSPALNAADPTASPPTDQRGVLRPSGAGPDIGAYELAPLLTPTLRQDGTLILDCVSEAAITNHFAGSTDLIHWTWLGARVADAEGKSQLEDNTGPFPVRFYQVRPVSETAR